MLMFGLALGAAALAGSPTALTTNPAIQAKIIGQIPAADPGTSTTGLRVALRNASNTVVTLNACPQGMKIQHFRVSGSNIGDLGTDVSFGSRTDSGTWRSKTCDQLSLQPNSIRTVDYYYYGGRDSSTNANRITIDAGVGSFEFVSNPVLAARD